MTLSEALPLSVSDSAIGDPATAVYCYAAQTGEIRSLEGAAAALGLPLHEVFAAVTRLMELRLLRTDGTEGGRLVPVDAEYAASQLVSPIERAIYENWERLDRLRDSIAAVTRPPGRSGEPVGAIARVEGPAQIRGLLKLAADVCREEVVVLRGSHGDEETVDELLEACYSVLNRDISVRVICPHRNRASFATRAKARRLVEGGAQIRTISQVPQAGVVFDRSMAVVLDLSEDGTAPPTARRVRDDGVVRFLVDLFDQLWDGASPFEAIEPGYSDVVDDLHQSIARLMAQGYTDEVVARRLGMSVRTCRRHIAALLRDLDAVSRFQAGVQAAHRFTMEGARTA
ncbi:hypothetical protein [Streptomyces sp. TBY4]|uniref:helix-turn-helix transcriptional regulator n=1 Tax=Streptomyces sp. TBY4 TaxID=2962030 RepID=UPI0020B6EAA1|nr:hypothetical protein [Streptomyces sp. TBY4]MCP3760519.1 hypothetical protein [Streptomyces sp. TBY4]